MITSRIRPPVEIGFRIEEDTVSSCVEVQKSALPRLVICVCLAPCSKTSARTAQIKSIPIVVTAIATSLSLRWACVGVFAYAMSRTSLAAARMTRVRYMAHICVLVTDVLSLRGD